MGRKKAKTDWDLLALELAIETSKIARQQGKVGMNTRRVVHDDNALWYLWHSAPDPEPDEIILKPN